MKRFVYLLFAVTALFGCDKFDHKPQSIPDCVLCEYALTLEGDYRGYAFGASVPNNGDSTTITLERVFLGASQYEDSIKMRLKATFQFDSSPNVLTDTFQVVSMNGQFAANPRRTFDGSGNEYLYAVGFLTPDSMSYSYSTVLEVGSENYFGGNFYK